MLRIGEFSKLSRVSLRKLENAISEYMASPSTERTYQAVHGMVDCWEAIDSMEQCL